MIRESYTKEREEDVVRNGKRKKGSEKGER